MDFGMPTLIENDTLEDNAKLCNELGLRFVELNMNLPQFQSDVIDVDFFKGIAQKYGMYYTIHMDEQFDFACFNSRVAEAYIAAMVDTISLAKQLRVPVINMHLASGVYFTLPNEKVYLYETNLELFLDSVRKFRDIVREQIGDYPLKICIENCSGYKDFQLEAIDILLSDKRFALTFDIGHDYCIGGKDKDEILARKNRLFHMHLHDATQNNNHLPLGDGNIDIKEYLSLAKEHDCRVVLETKTVDGLKKSVQWLRDI